MKRADRSGAACALILGDDELDAGVVTVKPLRTNAEQQSVAMAELANYLLTQLAG